MSLRATVKALLETGLVWSGGAALRRAALVRRTLVLAYHNVVPDDGPCFGDRSLHLPRRMFVRQIEHLLRTHAVVPLEEIFTPAPPGRRPRVALTFDDAYRGAVDIGVAELAKRGVPATLFVVPAFVGRGPFWWDAVASEDRDVDPILRDYALQELSGKDRSVRSWAEAHGLRLRTVPDSALVASEDELGAAIRHPGITLASHTWSHPNLARLSPAELQEELSRPLHWLRQRYGSVIPWLSYPYGLATRTVEAAAAAAGYAAAVALGGGWFSPARVSRHSVPRLNVPSALSANGFVLRTSGLYAGRS
jgi:peptidoglycan/xylan/chitin deacetylase (PgdA/CDA1 family)